MKRQILFLLFAFLSMAGNLCGQTFSGIITDGKTGKPLDGANVVLVSAEGKLCAYAISDAEGAFRLTVENRQPSDRFRFSFLGYKPLEMDPAAYPADGRIRLESEPFILKEVEVSARRIEEKQDTLVYSVAGFSMPQDRSIADVISKMPGMEVKANGQIAYNGKNINKFYIEGMDLMGDRYALASNNLSRKRVRSVEIIRNHQPVEMLRGKVFSEQAALNLILEDDSKWHPAVSADVGGGADRGKILYQNRLLGMLFGKKQQNLSLYKNDNTGTDLFREINPIAMTDLADETAMEESLIAPVAILTPDFDRSRYNFNRSHLIATNHLARPAEKTTLRTQLSFFRDISEQSTHIETRYLFDEATDGNAVMYESDALHERRNRLDGSLTLEINRADLYLYNQLKGTFDGVFGESSTVWNGADNRLRSTPDRMCLSDELAWKLPLRNDRHVSFRTVNTYNRYPQTLTLYSGETQRLDYTSFLSHTSTSFRHRLAGMFVNYTAGWKVEVQTLSADIRDDAERTGGVEKQKFVGYRPYLGANLHYKAGGIQTEGEVMLHLVARQLKGSGTDDGMHVWFHPEARLSFGYDFDARSTVSIRYRYAEEVENLRRLYSGDLFVSYRSVTDNRHTYKPEASHHLSLRYQYSHPVKGIFLSVLSSAGRMHRHSAYHTVLLPDNLVIRRNRVDVDYPASNIQLGGRLSKSFARWKSLLTLDGSFLGVRSSQYENNGLKGYVMDNYAAGVSFSARPCRFLSFELGTSWQRSQMRQDTRTTIDKLKYRADVSLPLFTGFTLTMRNTYHASLDTGKDTWFVDLSALYTLKRLEFEVRADNLIGKDRYEQAFVSSIEENVYTYTLRPRELIGKISFHF